MRIVGIALLSLVLGAGAVLAQAGAPPPTAPIPPAKAATPGDDKPAAKARAKQNIAECMGMWDAATHMTKQQWAQTCERIQIRLENLRIENMDFMGTSLRKKKS